MSDTCTGFTRFTVLNEEPPDGYTWSGKRQTRKQTISRPDTVWPEIWYDMSEQCEQKQEQQWDIEKLKLDNARRFRSIRFIDPAEYVKETLERAEKVGCSHCFARSEDKSKGKPVALTSARRNTLALWRPMNL